MPLKPLVDEVLSCKQEKSVRFRTGAPKLFREIQARCRDLTVNQWLGEFDSHTRSQFYPWSSVSVHSNAQAIGGSIPPTGSKFCKCQQENVTLCNILRRCCIAKGKRVRLPADCNDRRSMVATLDLVSQVSCRPLSGLV
jgi:hypothetical protein